MSDIESRQGDGDEIDVGDVSGSGSAIGRSAHNQSVTINNEIDKLTNRELKQMIVNVMERNNAGLQSLEVRYYELKRTFERQVTDDHKDRVERQHETDQHRVHLNERIDRIESNIDKKTEEVQKNIALKLDKMENWILVLFVVVAFVIFFLVLVLFVFIAFRASLTFIFPWPYLLYQ